MSVHSPPRHPSAGLRSCRSSPGHNAARATLASASSREPKSLSHRSSPTPAAPFSLSQPSLHAASFTKPAQRRPRRNRQFPIVLAVRLLPYLPRVPSLETFARRPSVMAPSIFIAGIRNSSQFLPKLSASSGSFLGLLLPHELT
jgi:hypothetical protein